MMFKGLTSVAVEDWQESACVSAWATHLQFDKSNMDGHAEIMQPYEHLRAQQLTAVSS